MGGMVTKLSEHLKHDFTAAKVLELARSTFFPPLFPAGMDDNQQLTLFRLALLCVAGRISRNTLESAVDDMKPQKKEPIKNPVGYLVQTIANDLVMKGIDIEQELDKIAVPPELLAAWKDTSHLPKRG